MSTANSRMFFPLAPIAAVLALSMIDVLGLAHGSNSDARIAPLAAAPTSMTAHPLNACCLKLPSRGASSPKFSVKYSGHNFNGVDYDAGNALIDINCTFDDLDAEHPVVGMSSLGLLRRMQTDTGSVVEGTDGFGIVNPAIQSFKNSPFQVRAKVPLHTHVVIMLNGALTVLRARERADMSWREPFSTQFGVAKKSSGFEVSLSKADMGADSLTAEWTCRPDPESAIDAGFWTRRQLKTSLIFADKSVAAAESGTETPYLIRRVFRHNKKFPVSIELNFVSDLRTENLPFTLTNLQLDGAPGQKAASGKGQDF